MIYDFSLLSSFLFASLMLLIAGYTKHIMQRLSENNLASGKAEKQYNSKRLEINRRLIIFIAAMIVISRITFLITFPMEIEQFSLSDSIFSVRPVFLAWQSIVMFIYIYFLFRIFLGNQLQDEYRYLYLGKTILFYAIIVIIDLLSSFIFYVIISYNLIFPVTNAILQNNTKLGLSNNLTFILLVLAFVAGVIVFFLRIQKKRTPFNFMGYLVLYIVNVSLVLFILFDHLEFFFNGQSISYSALNVFKISLGFSGWIMLALLFLGFSSQTLGYTIIRWKDKFISKQIAVNYVVQLNKLSFISLICITCIALLPLIFNGLVHFLY